MLKKSSINPDITGPIVTIVLDGFGISKSTIGNAIHSANTPIYDSLFQNYGHTSLKAHGVAVGMPSDSDMGNSEVGHNAIGAGQVYLQGAALVSEAIENGSIFEDTTWKDLSNNSKNNNSTLHFIGLFSDGNVHSHINHLKAMILQAKKEGVSKVRLHLLLDGRDVPSTSALDYVEPFEVFLNDLRASDFDIKIASGGGRMKLTMDRYEADWSMVERGWQAHVLGEARQFNSTKEAVETFRSETPGLDDQNLDGFVIAENGEAVGPILDSDSVIFYNFRGDRAIEISQAFENGTFTAFDRKRFPKVKYAGMLQYDGDAKIPEKFLVAPPAIKNTMGQALADIGISQLAISETQKFGHVTYFWNGNNSSKFDTKSETWIEVESDNVPFEQRPWMKAAEITDELIKALRTGKHKTARINYANGDMVGHTGDFKSAMIGIESVDLCLGRLLKVIDELKGIAIITADHGNADEMYELNKKTKEPIVLDNGTYKPKTSHTLNPVPFILYDNQTNGKIKVCKDESLGLSNIASSIVNLLGYETPENWDKGILSFH